jgi:hypothetical protein
VDLRTPQAAVDARAPAVVNPSMIPLNGRIEFRSTASITQVLDLGRTMLNHGLH